jgi:hypothetical protein
MPTPEQKKIWKDEKTQMQRDKRNQPREIHRRAVNLSLGGKKQAPQRGIAPDQSADEFLRKRLGI